MISKNWLKEHARQTPQSQGLWPASAWDYERFGPNIVLVFKVVHVLQKQRVKEVPQWQINILQQS